MLGFFRRKDIKEVTKYVLTYIFDNGLHLQVPIELNWLAVKANLFNHNIFQVEHHLKFTSQ